MPEQLSFFDSQPQNEPQTVSQLTRYIRGLFERDELLGAVWVEGEISNFKRAASGHMYFSLKDEDAQLQCVMWKNAAEKLRFEPQHGDQVIAFGSVTVYDKQGAYQLYAEMLQRAGVGDLNRQFELLKAKLEAEGLFAQERKRPIPAFPRKIGIVTSPDAAGFQDVLKILTRRYPSAEVVLSPTLVQGSAAPPSIVAAIQALNRRADIDVMLIVRGGGSLEDMWCFNDESVVRAVVNSRIPTITGVGHEIDFTLVDFAADLRAPTPSAAAELATPDREELLYTLRDAHERMTHTLRNRLGDARQQLDNQQRTLRLLNPARQIANLRQSLDDQSARMGNALRAQLALERQKLDALAKRLGTASPHSILERGYALVMRAADGKRMTSVQDAAPGTSVLIQMRDGQLTARVNERKFNA